MHDTDKIRKDCSRPVVMMCHFYRSSVLHTLFFFLRYSIILLAIIITLETNCICSVLRYVLCSSYAASDLSLALAQNGTFVCSRLFAECLELGQLNHYLTCRQNAYDTINTLCSILLFSALELAYK